MSLRIVAVVVAGREGAVFFKEARDKDRVWRFFSKAGRQIELMVARGRPFKR